MRVRLPHDAGHNGRLLPGHAMPRRSPDWLCVVKCDRCTWDRINNLVIANVLHLTPTRLGNLQN